MDRKTLVLKFLNDNRVTDKNVEHNFVSMADDFKGKFNLDSKQRKEFFKLYIDAVKKGCVFSIAEKPKKYGPLVIDLDFKINKDQYKNERLYNNKQINLIISCFVKSIKKYLDVTTDETYVSIFEKEKATIKSNEVKDGVHIIFYNLTIHYKLRHLIRIDVINMLEDNELFSNYKEPIDKIIDEAVIYKNFWLLPGSKKPDGYLYNLTHIYKIDDENNFKDTNIENIKNNYEKLVDTFRLQNVKYCEDNKTNYNENYDLETIEDEYNNLTKKKTKKSTPITNKINNDKTDEINKLLSCLDYNRFRYEYWFNIGCIIYNETNNIDLWKDWSKDYENYDENEIDKKWDSFKDLDDNKLTIGTLVMYAKEDNLEKYNDLFRNKNKTNLFDDVLTTRSIGKHFKTLYGDKFIYQNGKLYYYNGVYWHSEDIKEKLININNFIGDVYFNDLMALFRDYEMNEIQKSKMEKRDINTKKLDNSRTYIINLLNHKRRQELINELICILSNDEIKFDSNPYLFAFNNKIYDLKQGAFIEPKPEYYISLTTGYNFIEQNETNNIKTVNSIINSIFPDEDIKNLYLTILSTGLDGIPLEKFVIANGGGGNGKGLLNEFVQYMLGSYAYVLPVNILLGPLKTGSNPEIANMNNKRLVIAREPDRNLQFNCATIKEITGGSEINARLNHSNDTKVNLKLTFLLECNDKPQLNEVNDALSRRVLDIPFKNKFVDQKTYDELEEEEKQNTYLINPYYKTLEFKEQYRQALFLILAQHYKNYNNNDKVLNIPDEIVKRNKDYLSKSDDFLSIKL
jgi:hypothetical protein